MEKEIIKADGNCLFNSATLAMENTVAKPMEMRETIAAIIMSDPTQYSKKTLGKDPAEYVSWLLSGSAAWGGIPELRVMSQYYGVEIGVADI